MDENIQTILTMTTDGQIQIENFSVDTYLNLLNKFKALADTDKFIEDSVKKVLSEHIEMAIEHQEKAKARAELLQMLKTVCMDK